MTSTTDSTRTACPTWCTREHLQQASDPLAGGFHHDAEQWPLLLTNQPIVDGDTYAYVNTAQFVDDEMGPAAPTAELTIDSTVAVLTPTEARQVAQALLEAAARAETSRG
jgi:hypothetical protein